MDRSERNRERRMGNRRNRKEKKYNVAIRLLYVLFRESAGMALLALNCQ